jgi:hypothetical protein
MTINAILRDGRIQPLEPIPFDWVDGRELVEEPDSAGTEAKVEQWATEMDQATGQNPPEEHDRFLRALDEIEQECEDAVRRCLPLRPGGDKVIAQ